jgi:ATP-binding cassette subfamily C (CFTR/MRP) protein 1
VTCCSGLHADWPAHRSPLLRRGAPVESIAILALMGSLVGLYSLPGVLVVCLIVPAQYYFGFRIIKNKVANVQHVNDRFVIIQEILPAMKLVKYYAWERFFESSVR